ncbi:hypothetical protein GYH30_051786 [Glycine max]|nr:hypothetical protein GYH30_051786 [Glycine max]
MSQMMMQVVSMLEVAMHLGSMSFQSKEIRGMQDLLVLLLKRNMASTELSWTSQSCHGPPFAIALAFGNLHIDSFSLGVVEGKEGVAVRERVSGWKERMSTRLLYSLMKVSRVRYWGGATIF